MMLLILCTTTLPAQKLNNHLVDTVPQTELGVNTTPILVYALSGETINNYSLSFRKQYYDKAFRLRIISADDSPYAEDVYSYAYDNSGIKLREFNFAPIKYFGVAAGFEYYNPYKKFRLYWGFDLLARYYTTERVYSEYNTTVTNQGTIFKGSLNESGQLKMFQWAAGAGIKGGVRFPISTHIFLQTETHFNAVLILGKTRHEESGNTSHISKETPNGFADTEVLIPELTLYYRFSKPARLSSSDKKNR
ncbi:MAG: hypothetical protein ABI723_20340 [Bacteroidia bacterium]